MKQLIIVIIIFFALVVKAQHNHGNEEHNEMPVFKHLPKHGGEIVEAGKYKLEILISPISVDEKLTVYILKNSYKEIQPKELTGYVIMKFKSGQIDTVSLISDKGKLYATDINVSLKSNMIFKIYINGKNVSGIYFNNGIIKN
ncbi:MAG: hypothetical protein JNJ40_12790 [Bacteroidia bacterium]|nr:hypothetical protein [Bacteroidia bacterium]